MALTFAILMGVLGGPALAWATRQKGSVAAFEKRKAKFAAGEGRDPEKDMIGPHRSFGHNALIFGVVFFAIGFFIGSMA